MHIILWLRRQAKTRKRPLEKGIELGRIYGAVASYERALSLQPDHFNILLSKGDALQHLGRFDEAFARSASLRRQPVSNLLALWTLKIGIHTCNGHLH
jgi:tetratricopeptide (TPR) repeat protein